MHMHMQMHMHEKQYAQMTTDEGATTRENANQNRTTTWDFDLF